MRCFRRNIGFGIFRILVTYSGMEQVKVLFVRGTIKMAAGPECIRPPAAVNVDRLVENESQWPTKYVK